MRTPILPVGHEHITNAPSSPEQIIPTHILCTRRDNSACSVHVMRVIGSYLWPSSGESESPPSTFFLAPTGFIVPEFRKEAIKVRNYFMKPAKTWRGRNFASREAFVLRRSTVTEKVEVSPKAEGSYAGRSTHMSLLDRRHLTGPKLSERRFPAN